MANYSVTNSTVLAGNTPNAITTTYASLIAVAASSGGGNGGQTNTGLRRGKLYDILVGTTGTPADYSMEWEVIRATVGTTLVWLGSISSVSSATALDLADVGACTFMVNNSTAQTNIAATGQPWYVGINQRASYRWVAAPGSEIVWPALSSATGNNGLSLNVRSVSGGTVAPTGNLLIQEQ
jgi:hypothetical protein